MAGDVGVIRRHEFGKTSRIGGQRQRKTPRGAGPDAGAGTGWTEPRGSVVVEGNCAPQRGHLGAGGVDAPEELGAVEGDGGGRDWLVAAGVVDEQASEEAVVTAGAGLLRGASRAQGGYNGASCEDKKGLRFHRGGGKVVG